MESWRNVWCYYSQINITGECIHTEEEMNLPLSPKVSNTYRKWPFNRIVSISRPVRISVHTRRLFFNQIPNDLNKFSSHYLCGLSDMLEQWRETLDNSKIVRYLFTDLLKHCDDLLPSWSPIDLTMHLILISIYSTENNALK